MTMKSIKKAAAALALCVVAGGLLAAADKVTLKFPTWGTPDLEYYTKVNEISAAYQKVNPNVIIEVEQFKNTEDFENAMKIRFAAGEYPDVISIKPYMLSMWADKLVDLKGQAGLAANLYPNAGVVDGKTVGIGRVAFNEYVYYHKSLFAKAGVQVPQTWGELIEAAKKLRAAGITPFLIGAKDVWPTYPFTEYMPALVSGNGAYWNSMTTQDAPFAKGSGINKAYTLFQDLVKANAFDVTNAIGQSFDQAKLLFGAKKGAMWAAGMWFYSDFVNLIKGDVSDIGVFYLPVREKQADPFNITLQVDNFMAVPKGGKHVDEALRFMNWMVNSDYYAGYVNYVKALPAAKGVSLDEKLFDTAPAAVKGGAVTPVIYDGGNALYQKLADTVQFDCKRVGQEILVGRDLAKIFDDLNAKWKKARAAKK